MAASSLRRACWATSSSAWTADVIAVIQRVTQARVEIAGRTVGAIDQGLLVLVCAEPADTEAIADKLVAKLLKLRIFSDGAGKMNRSVVDVQGGRGAADRQPVHAGRRHLGRQPTQFHRRSAR